MLCDYCTNIPLDIFLPYRACGMYNGTGRIYQGRYQHFEGATALEGLNSSANAGCHMCNVILNALNVAEPHWAIPPPITDRKLLHAPKERIPVNSRPLDESGITIMVQAEGQMIIKDGVRACSLWWWNETMGQGRKAACPVSASADSSETFALAISWLKTCTETHRDCKYDQDPPFLPTRLIDIGTAPGGINPRLIQTNVESNLPGPKYLALSHCWGSRHVLKTTVATLRDHQERISWSSLSKTFQDAMVIAQRLGIRYIWIDSLCIIQDDPRDFEAECGRMNLVYSRAHCTVSASDSPDGEGGCFVPRDPNRIQTCTLVAKNRFAGYHRHSIMDPIFGREENNPESAEIHIFPNFGQWRKAIQGPVSARGWCLQERELSPRMLHYTKDRLLWECRECIASEDHPEMQRKQESNLEVAEYLSSWRLLDGGVTATTTVAGYPRSRAKWYAMAEEYSRRALSLKTDKLPALSGIAAEIAKRRQGDRYLAGLWKDDIFRGLSWFPDPVDGSSAQPASSWPPTAVDAGLPSWSWTAWDGPVRYHGESWFGGTWEKVDGNDGDQWVKRPPRIQLLDSRIKQSSLDPFGRVGGSEIVLSGWAIEVSVSEAYFAPDLSANLFRHKCYSLAGHLSGPYSAVLYFDADVDELPTIEVVCLQLGVGKGVRGTPLPVINGLVLTKIGEQGSDAYRRVGMFDVGTNDEVWMSRRSVKVVHIV